MRKGMGRNTHYLYADNQKPLSGKEYPLEKTVSAITDTDGNKDYAEPYFQVKKAPNEYGGAKPISKRASFDTVLFMTFQYECSGTTGFLGGGKPKCGKNTKGVQIHRLETFELPVKQTKWEGNVLTCKIDNKKAKLTLLGDGELKFNKLPSGLQKRVKIFDATYPVTAVYVKTKKSASGGPAGAASWTDFINYLPFQLKF